MWNNVTVSWIQWGLLLPVIGGSIFSVLCVWAALRFRSLSSRPGSAACTDHPPVSIVKPICGLEKNLEENLRSTCTLDYPAYEVVLCVQNPADPALPLLWKLQREYGEARVTVAIDQQRAGGNGKINNLLGGLAQARHDLIVISDSDILLPPDYLRAIVAPFADPSVGCVCTPYRAVAAGTWFEKMELLSFNADFVPNVVFAQVTGASPFCLGASTAVTRATLARIGGLASLAEYLVEDYEMGRRTAASGKRIVLSMPIVDTTVDLRTAGQWWAHQVYWDQNTRTARPIGFFFTVLTRAVPFAALFAAVRWFDPLGLVILAAAVAVRLGTTAVIMRGLLRDREGIRALHLLPLRDMAALISWFLAMTKRTTTWRGSEFRLTRSGRLVPKDQGSCEPSSSPETISASVSR
jgi:ceramide glucosyltransferase